MESDPAMKDDFGLLADVPMTCRLGQPGASLTWMRNTVGKPITARRQSCTLHSRNWALNGKVHGVTRVQLVAPANNSPC
jgi:hypothetical protein